MNCDFSEKVSQLIDGELSSSEANQVRKHISGCQLCSQAEQDFLGLRNQIKSDEFDTDPLSQRQTLWKIMASQPVPLWRRKIALPAPIFAVVVLALLALGAWSVFFPATHRQTREPDKQVNNLPVDSPPNIESGGMDLSRFDRGERAILYKERRSKTSEVSHKGATR